jgi:probable F420-dependent oxidoreductase
MSATTVSVIPAGELVYGIQLPIQALSVMTSMPWERDAGVDDLRRAALAAEAAGFFYVAICDHVAIPREKAETMSTTWFNPVATLGWIAGQTERVRLMTNVYVAAYRHPLETAKMFATLDHLSGGRVILGVGAGHVEGEFAALGISFADRGRLTNEAIDGILDAWTDEFVGDVGLRPRPAQQPRPPIWIGGSGPRRTLPLVARYADVWHAFGTPNSLREASERLDGLAVEAGRDPADILRAGSLSLDDLDTARRHAGKWRDAGYGYLVCGWPGAGADQVERFAREVMGDLAS